jgi:hypothetical protein
MPRNRLDDKDAQDNLQELIFIIELAFQCPWALVWSGLVCRSLSPLPATLVFIQSDDV